MTKTIVIGEKSQEQKKKPIEFFTALFVNGPAPNDMGLRLSVCEPKEYDVIELICHDYAIGLDLMFAYNGEKRSSGVAYLGKWNDGVVS